MSSKLIFVVTGTRKGIGYEIAKYYLELGNVVYGCSRGDSSIVHENYYHFSLDVSDENKIVGMLRECIKKHDKIDVLINNAGIASMNHLILTSLSSVKNVISTNFIGTFLFLREAAKCMMRNNYGRIINFSTVAVPLNLEGEAIYASSKAAIESLTKISAKELANYNITVNTIGPAPILTDLIKVVPKDKIDELIKNQSIKKFARFEDVINIINFYIAKESSLITGQTIYLCGIN
jgi:3-oxoacyl-[acyl-carrier protein] reductase